uniref:Uncharacterized protein n=1 Tax=Myotis myotis TaxID=51298 RepID=A0A7J7RMJ4_MYOMY|nr:hypothetical protein mMyoMyo1_010250 [Myotis myotis]
MGKAQGLRAEGRRGQQQEGGEHRGPGQPWSDMQVMTSNACQCRERIFDYQNLTFVVVNPHPRVFFPIDFRQSGREGERQREKHRCERDTLIGCLPHAPRKGLGLKLQPRYVPLTRIKPGFFSLKFDTLATEPNGLGARASRLIEEWSLFFL